MRRVLGVVCLVLGIIATIVTIIAFAQYSSNFWIWLGTKELGMWDVIVGFATVILFVAMAIFLDYLGYWLLKKQH
jgi:hypothetical protein